MSRKNTPHYGCYQKTGIANHVQPVSKGNSVHWGTETPMTKEARAMVHNRVCKSSISIRLTSGCKYDAKKYGKKGAK